MPPLVPESEGGAASEEDGLGFGLGLLEEPEEGVVLHADLPEHLAAVPASHEELQGVLVRTLGWDEQDGTVSIRNNSADPAGVCVQRLRPSRECEGRLTFRSALSLMRKRFLLKEILMMLPLCGTTGTGSEDRCHRSTTAHRPIRDLGTHQGKKLEQIMLQNTATPLEARPTNSGTLVES